MKFNTSNDGQWFFFDEEKKEDGSIMLRPLTTTKYQEFDRKSSKTTPKFYNHDIYHWSERDDIEFNQLVLNYCIVDWKNIVDQNNQELKCTSENKNLLSINSNEFLDFVTKKIGELNKIQDQDEEAKVKN